MERCTQTPKPTSVPERLPAEAREPIMTISVDVERPVEADRGRQGGRIHAAVRTLFTDGYFGIWLLAGFVIRVVLSFGQWQGFDADQATGMVMAMRSSFRHPPVFFWGGNYGGTLLTWIQMPLVRAFGFHIAIFRLTDIAFAALAAILLWIIARRVLSPTAAAIGAGLFWLAPPAAVYYSTREYVFWQTATCAALLTAYAALRFHEQRSRSWALLVGLGLGATFWLYPLFLCVALPAAAASAVVMRRRPSQYGFAGLGVVIGASPWIAVALHRGLNAATTSFSPTDSRAARLHHSITELLPAAINRVYRRGGVATAFYSQPRVSTAIGLGIMVIALGWLVWWWRARELKKALVGLCIFIWPVLIVASGVATDADAWRYALPVLPALALIAGHLGAKLKAVPGLLVLTLAVVVVVVAPYHGTWPAARSCTPQQNQVIEHLEATGRTSVWGSYWAAAPLEVCSRGRITASALIPIRDVVAEHRVMAAPRTTVVVMTGFGLDKQLAAIAPRFAGTRRLDFGDLGVWEFPGHLEMADLGQPLIF